MDQNHVPVISPTHLSDVTFHTIMDTGFFGLFRLTPYMHTHPYFEIQVAIDGTYSIEFMNRPLICMENDMVCLIPPSCYHSTQAISEKPQKLAVRFSYGICSDTKDSEALYHLFRAIFEDITEPVSLKSPELCSLMLQIYAEMASPKVGSNVMAQLYLGQFYMHLLRLMHAQSYERIATKVLRQDSDSSRYNKIELWFGEHFTEQITESDLADALSLSKRQTARILRNIYGMTFHEKLLSIRMMNAANMLTQTDTPIREIADKVGYNSVMGFYLAFKKYFGTTGSEYRKHNKSSEHMDT